MGPTLVAVQAAGQNPGGRCLSAPPGSAEKIRMVHAVCGECLHEWFRDLRLANELSKSLGSVSTIKSSNHAVSLPGSPDRGRAPGDTKDSPRTHQSPVTLATFPSWGS